MHHALLIGLGGFIGSIFRYLMSGWVQDWMKESSFPLGTLAVNLLGCLTIGILAQLAESRAAFSPEARAFLFIGILGGFTTFSSFGNETMNLYRDGESLLAFANIAAHIILCLGAVWLGRVAAVQIWR